MENKNSVDKLLIKISKFGIFFSIILVILISYFSLVSSDKITSISYFPFGDKGAHMFAYAVFGVFLYFSFSRISFTLHHKNRDILASNWIVLPSVFTIGIGIIVGTLLEIIQIYVSRDFDLLDIASDGLGLMVGCAIGFYILKFIVKITLNKE